MRRELRDIAKDIDVSEIGARVKPLAEAAAQAAKTARDTMRERAPSSEDVLRSVGLERRRSRRASIVSWPLLIGVAAGAAAVYFFDVDQGARRRATLRDRFVGLANDARRNAQRTTRMAGSTARGMTGRLTSVGSGSPEFVNDAQLVSRVESEAFRGMDDDAKSYINVNSVGGVVFIRGEVPTAELIADIEERVRRVRGVRDVENLMHLPGTPAPTAP